MSLGILVWFAKARRPGDDVGIITGTFERPADHRIALSTLAFEIPPSGEAYHRVAEMAAGRTVSAACNAGSMTPATL